MERGHSAQIVGWLGQAAGDGRKRLFLSPLLSSPLPLPSPLFSLIFSPAVPRGGLLLALCSVIIPGGLQGTLWVVGWVLGERVEGAGTVSLCGPLSSYSVP